jgi:hypothetical protein
MTVSWNYSPENYNNIHYMNISRENLKDGDNSKELGIDGRVTLK